MYRTDVVVQEPVQAISSCVAVCVFFFQAEDGIRDVAVTGVQTCALPICAGASAPPAGSRSRATRRPADRPPPGRPRSRWRRVATTLPALRDFGSRHPEMEGRSMLRPYRAVAVVNAAAGRFDRGGRPGPGTDRRRGDSDGRGRPAPGTPAPSR